MKVDLMVRLVDSKEACRRERELDNCHVMPDCPWGIGPDVYDEMARGIVGLRQVGDSIPMKDGKHKLYEVVGGEYKGFMVPDIFIKEEVGETPRYIDANRLKLVLAENGLVRSNLIALKHIDEVPTADVQEVRHSRWVNFEDCDDGSMDVKAECANCHAVSRMFSREHPHPYCWQCGAKCEVTEDAEVH